MTEENSKCMISTAILQDFQPAVQGRCGIVLKGPSPSKTFHDFKLLFLIETSKEDESLLRKLIHSKLVASKADLEILQKDPNSPLYSVKTFEALNL